MIKTYKIKKSIAFISVLSCALLAQGCENKSITSELGEVGETDIAQLAPNVRVQMSYDQKQMSFTPFWPSDVVASKAKQVSGNTEFMVGYENTHEIVAFDEQGYVYTKSKYLEGNADVHMPQDLYDEVKDNMPAPASDYNPIAGYEVGNGTLTYYAESGEIISQHDMDMERTRLAPDLLQELIESRSETSVDKKIEKNKEALKKLGLNFREVSNTHILLSQQVEADGASSSIAEYQELIDLRIGRPVRTAIKNAEGLYESFTQLSYKVVDGFPVVENTEEVKFGMHDGEWTTLRRTITNRSNIKLRINQ